MILATQTNGYVHAWRLLRMRATALHVWTRPKTSTQSFSDWKQVRARGAHTLETQWPHAHIHSPQSRMWHMHNVDLNTHTIRHFSGYCCLRLRRLCVLSAAQVILSLSGGQGQSCEVFLLHKNLALIFNVFFPLSFQVNEFNRRTN